MTAVEILDPYAHDGNRLPDLIKLTAANFDMSEVSADAAYSTERSLYAVARVGATPHIPFKRNATENRGGLWERMLHFYRFNQDEFLARYHNRSNVESTFSMVKAKFGDFVRSKTDRAMKNEVPAKLLCHNICCVIQSIYELGIEPVFWP